MTEFVKTTAKKLIPLFVENAGAQEALQVVVAACDGDARALAVTCVALPVAFYGDATNLAEARDYFATWRSDCEYKRQGSTPKKVCAALMLAEAANMWFTEPTQEERHWFGPHRNRQTAGWYQHKLVTEFPEWSSF